MAEIAINVENLSIETTCDGSGDDKTATVVVAFTIGVDNYRVTLPIMPHRELRELQSKLNYAIALIDPSAGMAGDLDDFTIDLDRSVE